MRIYTLFLTLAVAITQLSTSTFAANKTQSAAKPNKDTVTAIEQKPIDPELQIMSPLDVKDADIQDVVRTISKGYNLNIILDKDVSGKVTVHLSDVTVIEGLRTLTKSVGLDVLKEGNVYRIRKTIEEQRSVISFNKGKLTVDVQNMDVKDFLKDISAKTALSIVPDAKVEGKITGKLYQVELDDGLRALLEGSGLKMIKRKNIYQVIGSDDPQSGSNNMQQPPFPGYRRSGGGSRSQGSNFNVEYNNGRITLDVSNGNLQDVIKAISEQSDMEIITYGNIAGEINAKLKNEPLTEALALLLGGTMFTFVQKDSIILIGDRNAATPSGQALSKSELIHLNCIKADGVMQILPKDIPPNNVKVIKEQNALLVSGTSEDIVSVREFIKTIDIPTPQVVIDAVIVEYSENLSKGFNVKAHLDAPLLNDKSYSSLPSQNFQLEKGSDALELGASGTAIKDFVASTLGFGGNTLVKNLPENFFLFLSILEKQSRAKVLAQPSIVTLNGNKASINVNETRYFKVTTGNPLGGDYSIRFQPITFGIKLDITPWISQGGQITAEIAPEVSNSDGVSSDPEAYPNVSTRAITTTVRLNDGETIILGGLIKNQESDERKKIPFLGDIPLIGFLFRTNDKARIKSNLVVYITPHILKPGKSVNIKDELNRLDKSNREFMEKRIEESVDKPDSFINKNKPAITETKQSTKLTFTPKNIKDSIQTTTRPRITPKTNVTVDTIHKTTIPPQSTLPVRDSANALQH